MLHYKHSYLAHIMAEKIKQQLGEFHDSDHYTAMQGDHWNENMYELSTINKELQQSSVSTAAPNVAMEPKQRESSWSKPLLLITVLLCLILVLLIIILGIVVYDKYATGNNVECTNTATGASSSSNTNEWADRIVQNISQKIPDFNEWANGVVSKVNSSVTGSLPDFNEWANGVVSKVNSSVTGSLPDFDEWANGVVSKVNSSVTGSLPDFNEWANGVVSKVNSNVTGSFPDFNKWANGVVSKVNGNVTGSLPDFNEWANGVVSKVNGNVTGSLPDFNEWANGVVSKVNGNVTGSLPDFNEWANGVVSKVNGNVTGSLPDFNEWANGVSQNTLQLFQNNTNFTELDKQILQTTRDSTQKLINIVNTLSNLQDTSTSTAGVVDGILLIAQELLVLHNDSTVLPTSCKEIKERQPLSPSGVYLLANTNVTDTAYCNMGTLCGSGGGWTRLAYLDMTDATQNCPSGFIQHEENNTRACGRPVTSSGGSCVSVQFPSNGISYSQICGRVTGHSSISPDAVRNGTNHNNINSYYVDGVSITRGSPRKHVWTLMATRDDSLATGGHSNCPCVNGSTQVPQSFVGSHYFCEGAGGHWNDLLWDGKDCSADEALCCSAPGLPWFHRDYGNTTTTDYIELRVCADQETGDEDAPVSFYEIYVK